MSPWRALSMVVAAGLLLAGCTGSPTPSETALPAEVLVLMEAVPGIADVEMLGQSAIAHAAAEAPDDVVLAAVEELAAIGTKYQWKGSITLARANAEPVDPALDVTPRTPWSVEVYPTGISDSLRNRLLGILALEKLDGVVNVAIVDGWPYVTLASIDTFAATFRTLTSTPMFAGGGTVSLPDEGHLRIVWVPARTSLHAIDEIVSIAVDYPGAEVLLESATAGPQWPTLYIAKLSAEEAAAIDARLLDPALADADVEGYGLPFILTTVGAEGPVYLDGNLGSVVE